MSQMLPVVRRQTERQMSETALIGYMGERQGDQQNNVIDLESKEEGRESSTK